MEGSQYIAGYYCYLATDQEVTVNHNVTQFVG